MPAPLLCPRFCTPTSDSLSPLCPRLSRRCWQLEVPRGQGCTEQGAIGPHWLTLPSASCPALHSHTHSYNIPILLLLPRTARLSHLQAPPQPSLVSAEKELYVTGPALRGRRLDSAFLFFFLSPHTRSISVFPNVFTMGACYFVFRKKSALFKNLLQALYDLSNLPRLSK